MLRGKIIYRVKLSSCDLIFWEQVTQGNLPTIVFEVKQKIDKILDNE